MSVELKNRTKNFAITVIRLLNLLGSGKIEDVIKSQVLRSATSVGANYRAALRGRSKAEFISKLSIAEEQADETCYWLEIIIELGLISEDKVQPVYLEARAITAILTSAGKTAKANIQSL